MVSLLIYIRSPARIEVYNELPDALPSGAPGGFHPCGMWDYLIDSNTLEWCGVQFCLPEQTASRFLAANPQLDRSMISVRKPEEGLDGFADDGTSRLLQLVWSKFAKFEVIPALEFSDYWYAFPKKLGENDSDRFEPSREFVAVGIMDLQAKLDKYGFCFPRTFVRGE